MRKLITATVAASAALALVAAGSPTDRATGGGQVLVGTRGAGDTIAFTAKGDVQSARGQVQYVDRTGGTGQGQQAYHGTVDCLYVNGNTAIIGGEWAERDGGGRYELYVVDNGEGAAAESDVVYIGDAPENACDPENYDGDDAPDQALARGNAQVYDAG